MSATNSEGPTVAVKLFVDKQRSKVLFAESDNDFADVLFSFLTLPLGAIVRLLDKQSQVGCLDDFIDLLFGLLTIPLGSFIRTYGKRSSNGCVDNIYSSIDGSAKGCMNPELLMLLRSPKVAPFFGSGASNMLQADEAAPREKPINGCFMCFKIDGFSCHVRCNERKIDIPNIFYPYKNCNDRSKLVKLCEVNPKLPRVCSGRSLGYFKPGDQKFMVTDHLRVLPLSLTSTLQVVIESKILANDLVEKEITLTKVQVKELLRAAVVTRNSLSSVLLPPRKKP
ncbi:hypothetical protein GUJ93_ZPchr0458g22281 [Zizania palustris]|uniref:DUF674 family protein n=1 Tax=Zizania palustris TaxID=103762 RepID=A0A8J5RCT8_ZIZPA|nr:hypothetical protein GUJ93_ZPchr0458g22281 [Zizania palustris]